VLLSTNYALYSSSESDKKKLAQENVALKSRADQTQQQLDSKNARETKQAEARAEAQTKLQTVLPAVLRGSASAGEVASFARMVHALPNNRIELDSKPPDKLFRNWRVTVGSTTETYTLVGGSLTASGLCTRTLSRVDEPMRPPTRRGTTLDD